MVRSYRKEDIRTQEGFEGNDEEKASLISPSQERESGDTASATQDSGRGG